MRRPVGEAMRDYPSLTKAALLMARDSGAINRFRTERQAQNDIAKCLASQPDDVLRAIDEWLSGQSDDDLETICCGDQDEAALLMASAPPFTDQVLDELFEAA